MYAFFLNGSAMRSVYHAPFEYLPYFMRLKYIFFLSFFFFLFCVLRLCLILIIIIFVFILLSCVCVRVCMHRLRK